MSIRLAVARQRDADRDEVERAIDAHDGALSPAHQVAVEIADALMTMPSELSDDAVARARAAFTPEQLVELSLKVMKFNVQKVMVALGTDETLTKEALEQRVWNADGAFVVPD